MSNYYQTPEAVITMPEADRATFIRRTYGHLAGALLTFAVLSYFSIQTGIAKSMSALMTSGKFSWLIVLGVYMGVSYLAQKWADSSVSRNTQYAGLGLFVLLEVAIFSPLLLICATIPSMQGILPKATLITSGLFLGLTWIAFTTKKDFSFLGGVLKLGGMVALGVIVASILFGFNLGLIFSSLMLILLGGSVLYNTSNILHRYQTTQDVAAALGLFASFTTMLWYVIRILMSLNSRD